MQRPTTASKGAPLVTWLTSDCINVTLCSPASATRALALAIDRTSRSTPTISPKDQPDAPPASPRRRHPSRCPEFVDPDPYLRHGAIARCKDQGAQPVELAALVRHPYYQAGTGKWNHSRSYRAEYYHTLIFYRHPLVWQSLGNSTGDSCTCDKADFAVMQRIRRFWTCCRQY